MATVPVDVVTRAGGVETAAVSLDTGAGANDAANDGRTMLRVEEAGAAAATLDIAVVSGACSDSALTIAFLANEIRLVGPFPLATYGPVLSITETAGDLQANAYALST